MHKFKMQKENANTSKNAAEGNTENRNYPLVSQEKLEGTPFTIIHQEDKWFLVMGDHRMTNPTNTREQTLEKLENEKWLILMTMTAIIIEKMNNEKLRMLKNAFDKRQELEGIITPDGTRFETK